MKTKLRLSHVTLADAHFEQPENCNPKGIFGFHAKVEAYTDPDDDEAERTVIGFANAWVLTPCIPGFVDDCDSLYQDTNDVGFFLTQEEKRKDPHPALEYAARVLYISAIKLDPEFRGKDRGLSTLREIITTIGYGCEACMIIPGPMGKVAEGDRETITKKLRDHYARTGFSRIRDTEYMVLNLTECHDFLDDPWDEI